MKEIIYLIICIVLFLIIVNITDDTKINCEERSTIEVNCK